MQNDSYSVPILKLLRRFESPRDVTSLGSEERWRQSLGAPLSDVVQQLQAQGALRTTRVDERLSDTAKASELRAALKAAGQPTQGTKLELLQRLVKEAPTAAEQLASRVPVLLVLSDKGRDHVAQYAAWRRNALHQAALAVVAALSRGDVLGGVKARDDYHAAMGEPAPAFQRSDTPEVLRDMLTSHPGILRSVGPEAMQQLRTAAILRELFGDEVAPLLPTGFAAPSHLDDETAARMLLFYAWEQARRRQHREVAAVFPFAEVRCAGDGSSCEPCRRLAGSYALSAVPELPHPACTSPLGCRCSTVSRRTRA
jgi:hypothetical protein